MPMMQQDIRQHYEEEWKRVSESATDARSLSYSSDVEDAILYPLYKELVHSLKIRVDGGRVLDVGSGSGRWIRYFLERFKPQRLVGIDVTESSVALLTRWCEARPDVQVHFRQADISAPDLDLGERFDLINVANVLFHIPEEDLFTQALRNLARHVAPDGRIITTEYLPHAPIRTEWMLVRDRYSFAQAAADARLQIVDIRAHSIFSNDPMGVDGPDGAIRAHFYRVRECVRAMLDNAANPGSQQFIRSFVADIERAILAFCRERIADIDMPSQKLVVLAPM